MREPIRGVTTPRNRKSNFKGVYYYQKHTFKSERDGKLIDKASTKILIIAVLMGVSGIIISGFWDLELVRVSLVNIL